MRKKNSSINYELLEKGFSQLTPDCWHEIRTAIHSVDSADLQPVSEEPYRRSTVRKSIVAIAAVAAVFICVFSFVLKDAHSIESRLYLDADPSVCIGIDKKGEVASIEGINEDGVRVAEAVTEKNDSSRDLDTTVRNVLSEMDREGCFEEGTLEALISLSYTRETDSAVLEQICGTVKEYAGARELNSSFLSQSFARDRKAEKEAADIGISAGKYEFLIKLSDDGKLSREDIIKWADKPDSEIIDSFEMLSDKTNITKYSYKVKADPVESADKDNNKENDQSVNNDSTEKEKPDKKDKKSKKDKKEKKEKKDKKDKKEKKDKKDNKEKKDKKDNKEKREKKEKKDKKKDKGKGNGKSKND